MNLINPKNYYEAQRMLDSNRRIGSESMRRLLVALLQGCTPYRGYHLKVENAFEEFVKSQPKDGSK